MYYSSDEQDTLDITGKIFESHLKEKDTAKKAKEEKEKEGNAAKNTKSKGGKVWNDEEISLLIDMLEENLVCGTFLKKSIRNGTSKK